MKSKLIYFVIFIFVILLSSFQYQDEPNDYLVSPETEECIGCHLYINPGLVASWEKSLHAQISPLKALEKKKRERRISNTEIKENFQNVVVGCYECHSLNPENHADNFEHNGYNINIVVSSKDCATCHSVEEQQYAENIMSHAYGNLMDNVVYTDLRKSVNNNYHFNKEELSNKDANDETLAESCLYCHGTKLEVTGKIMKETDFGELEFPVIKGWPNQGVGRINTDGSIGSCTSCHPRHDFSIETARKPYTCSECHKGPDVPAYKVYEASKHGNIFNSKKDEFNFENVPWIIGKDFTAPTCASCHVSLIYDAEGTKIADRTHQFNDRLANRLFGVPYAHPHPISPDINVMKNSAGLPLATELNGEPVHEFLISEEEQINRNNTMKKVCLSCHSSSWTDTHFDRLDNTIENTNKTTIAATNILSEAWENGFAEGLPQSASIFDERIERDWTEVWLFYTNSIRLSSAMGGGGDYGVFANGRYQLSKKIIEMNEWLELHKKIYQKK
jgi:hydroxylamine dehydrogenase